MHRSEKSKYTKAKLAPKQKISYSKAIDPTVNAYAISALNWLRQAEFLMSAPKLTLCVDDIGYEIAFAGRSNAGKSSAINALTNQRQLARASKRPGRTQMINFFSLGNPEQRLVDLPGYGYAAVPEEMKRVWQKELENYLIQRQSLQGLVLLMDIRHPLQQFDLMMLQWAYSRHLFVHILLTKCDKLNRGPAHKVLLEVKEQLKKMKLDFSIQLFSSMNKQGLEELASVMAGRLHYTLDDNGMAIAHIPMASEADIDAQDATEQDQQNLVDEDFTEGFDEQPDSHLDEHVNEQLDDPLHETPRGKVDTRGTWLTDANALEQHFLADDETK